MNKISKTLLPISTVGLVASAVTPLVSCNKDEWANTIDLKTYTPSIDKLGAQPLSDDNAMEYLFNVPKSIEIVKQDIIMYLQYEAEQNLIKLLESLGITWAKTLQKEQCKLSNLSITYNGTEKIAYLTGTIKLRAIFDMTKKDDDTKVIGSYSVETMHEIHNLPYVMHWVPAQSEKPAHWASWFSRELHLSGNKNWNVRRSYYILADYNDETIPDEEIGSLFNYSYLNIDEYDPFLERYVNYESLKMVCWSSYYLQDCTK